MARSDEAEAFFVAVYEAIQEIPYGKVTSYGHIANLTGYPDRPRQVGVALKHLSIDPTAEFNNTNVPWQRVINSQGKISQRENRNGAPNQAAAIAAEGVVVRQNLKIDLAEFGWFPRRLPSREGESDEDEGIAEA